MFLALYLVLGIVFIIAIISFIAPKTYHISRHIEIDASKNHVFDYLKYFSKHNEWSAWARKDPNMNKKIIGIDGEIGTISYWNGNKEVGEGEQEITSIVEGERIEYELRFFKPFKSVSDCYMIAKNISENETKVILGFKGNINFPMNIFILFVSMDKMVGKDFEDGLFNLKLILEQKAIK